MTTCSVDVLLSQFLTSSMSGSNGNPLQCSCLEYPRDRGAWWAAVYGVAQSRTRLKRLRSSSSRFVIAFLPRNKHFLISWLQSPPVLILERKKIVCHCFHCFPIYFPCIAAAAAKLHQSCPTLCDPMDGTPPGSPVPGILQARTLEWVAIAFSKDNTRRLIK